MALNWLILGILIFLVIVFLKIKHYKHKIYVIIILFLLIFFYISGAKMTKNVNLNLRSFDGIAKITKIYFNWFLSIGQNLKSLIGNAIKMDWTSNLTSKAK